MIIGVTHDHDGRVVQRLSVSTKVSIGLPPNGDRNHPAKLDHFVFLRKKKTANQVEWEASGTDLLFRPAVRPSDPGKSRRGTQKTRTSALRRYTLSHTGLPKIHDPAILVVH
jgi:hypothetical protein